MPQRLRVRWFLIVVLAAGMIALAQMRHRTWAAPGEQRYSSCNWTEAGKGELRLPLLWDAVFGATLLCVDVNGQPALLILDTVAIYGAVLSSALAIIRIRDFLLDRSSVRVTLGQENCGPNDPRGAYVVISARNNGRRPVTLQAIGVLYLNGRSHRATNFWPPNVTWPLTLAESEMVKGFITADAFKARDVLRGFAEDSDGKVHRGRRFEHR
jgi:hypothetical protein